MTAKRPGWVECTAAMEWNNARHAALLVSPPEVAALLQGLDGQSDSLLVRAMAKQWTLEEFRKERDSLGLLAANFYMGFGSTAKSWADGFFHRSIAFRLAPVRRRYLARHGVWDWSSPVT